MKFFLLIFISFLMLACGAGKNQTQVDIIQDTMKDQISIKAQDWDPKQPGKPVMLLPPENTQARGAKTYTLSDPEVADKKLVNPLKGDMSSATLELGKKYYEIACTVCHGSTGIGDGPVAAKMPIKPPSLISGFASVYGDGRYYHTIVKGKGVMGAYAGQIREEKERWAVVNYIRSLQKEK